MRVIECRSCGTPHKIIPTSFEENEYPDKIRCIKCWSKTQEKSFSSVYVGGKKAESSSSSKSYSVDNKSSSTEFETAYEVGDSVFINTDKYGVLLCQILDTECWNNGEHTFYTVDAKGTIIDYVEEEEIFNSAEKAKNGSLLRVF